MSTRHKREILTSLAILFFAAILVRVATAAAPELLPPGFRPMPLGVHALVGGKVVVKPGEVLDSGTIVIRDGYIRAVGANVTPPADARLWDMKGLTIYAGFIDPYFVASGTNAPVSTAESEPISSSSFTAAGGVRFFGAPGVQTDMGKTGPGYDVGKVTPEMRAVESYSPRDRTIQPMREIGFTAAVVGPSRGIIRGSSALVALAEENPNDVIIRPDVFQHIAFEAGRFGEGTEGDRGAYPASLMGAIATIRQSFFDAQHYKTDRDDYAKRPQERRRPPAFNPSLEALQSVTERKIRVMFEPGSALMVGRSDTLAKELNLDYCVLSSGQEWRRPDLAKNAEATFVVPLNFPTIPRLPSEGDWHQITLDQLRAWDWAAENPAVLRQQGREIALTTYTLSDKKKFRSNLRLAIDRGLSENDALAALTTVPAKLCGVESQLGTIEAGKLAFLTVVDGKGYFEPEAKVREVWIDGRVYRPPAEEPKMAKAEDKTEESKQTTKPKEEPERQPTPQDVKPEPKKEEKPPETKPDEEKKDEKKDVGKKQKLRDLQKKRVARSPQEGRGPITNAPTVLIRNATIWTSSEQGVLTNSSIAIVNGKISQVGALRGAFQESQTLTIDGAGLHVTPGLIDCHSHSAVVGAVNESTLPSTAMVRIRDVVNSETDNLYEQLAGGLTAANLLHGSANPIGGQNCVIKLRDGAAPDELILADAPEGIKFALGENVKQSNWGDRNTTRFPQTRMGVRTFIANRFIAAQEYLQKQEDFRAGKLPVPPRRDLELEAIGEIIQGKRLIHCHSYRQDEILMLLRLMDSFKVKIGTLQHILEGYKVADEIATHGAGASSFADWWAYKFEVYDAIPYNGSIMRERGVVVSFNSDSSDLARRLYTEAAKAVKYGGTPEPEALKFVTINPAKQLHIDSRVGSLEPGKDADFVIWSKAPLDSTTVCLQTWIDGKKYFDRSLAADRASKLTKERDELIAKAKEIAKSGGGGGGGGSEGTGESGTSPEEAAFFRVSAEHEFDHLDRHCLDEIGGEE